MGSLFQPVNMGWSNLFYVSRIIQIAGIVHDSWLLSTHQLAHCKYRKCWYYHDSPEIMWLHSIRRREDSPDSETNNGTDMLMSNTAIPSSWISNKLVDIPEQQMVARIIPRTVECDIVIVMFLWRLQKFNVAAGGCCTYTQRDTDDASFSSI